jgi:HIRAN domain
MAQPPLTVPIAGFRHYSTGRQLLRSLALGTPLALVREPTNKHDDLAVQVWAEDLDLMFGYVPRRNNVDVAWALDGGVPIKAVFAGLQEQGQPAMQIVWP